MEKNIHNAEILIYECIKAGILRTSKNKKRVYLYMHYQDGDEAWEYNNATLLPGHGDKSVMMLQQHIQLTDEELYCIRWHMGAFDDKENWNSYGRAVTNFPNVLYTHTADMVAARILGV